MAGVHESRKRKNDKGRERVRSAYGGGDHGLFLVAEVDVDLGGSLREGGGLGRGLADDGTRSVWP